MQYLVRHGPPSDGKTETREFADDDAARKAAADDKTIHEITRVADNQIVYNWLHALY